MLVKILGILSFWTILTVESKSDDRLCPIGYEYAGDDTPTTIHTVSGYVFYEETDRSQIYSCYKKFPGDDFIGAMNGCLNDDRNSRLVSIDNGDAEAKRIVQKLFSSTKSFNQSFQIMTSALQFTPGNNYTWASVDLAFNLNNTNYDVKTDKLYPIANCLALNVEHKLNETMIEWSKIPCDDYAATTEFYVCEMRVQTVTYTQWIYNNWFNFLFIFLILLLVFSLCLSGCMYRNVRYQGILKERQRRAARTLTQNDNPPSYEDYVNAQRAHDGLPPKPNPVYQAANNRINQLKNKGREILATVHIFRQPPTGAEASSTRH